MTDLARFLLDRISDDEAAAHASADRPPIYPHYGDTAHEETWVMGRGEGTSEEGAAHIARWTPTRVLAECAARADIVKMFQLGPPAWDDPLTNVLHLLAAPYSDHPDFDPSWATEGTPQ